MSTMDLTVQPDAGALEADPVQYMAVVLNRAKQWLTEAASIGDVRDQKAIAVGMESVIREKELAFDAQLSATEIVRRCERRIGELVKCGQARGEIATRGERTTVANSGREQHLMSVADAFGTGEPNAQFAHRAMAAVSADEFEQAIGSAREEGNLSRANVVRKVKGEPLVPRQRSKPAHPSLDTDRGRTVAASHARRFTDMTHGIAGYAEGVKSLDIALIQAAMDPAELDECTSSLGKSLAALRRFRLDLQGGRES